MTADPSGLERESSTAGSPTAQVDLARLRAGDEHEVRKLVDILLPPLRALAHRLLASEDTDAAEDIVMDTLVRLVGSGLRIDFKDPATIYPYALRMVRNMAVHQRYRSRRLQRAVALEEEHWVTEPAAQTSPDIPEAVRARLESAIAALPPSQREVVVMRLIEGRSYQEIADLLQLEAAVVRQRVARATQALRKSVTEGMASGRGKP